MTRKLSAALLLSLALVGTAVPADTEVTVTVLGFDDLNGWAEDDHQAALDVFRNTCVDIEGPDWASLCALAHDAANARDFFELFFRPVLVEDGADPLFTGYFEPELDGSPVKTERYRYPVYRMPPEARQSTPWLSRRDILTSNVLGGRGLEIAWVDDPVELYFLQVQGSGRIRFPDGRVIRVGFAGSNGHSYRSIGQELVRSGVYQPHQVSAQVIRNWVRRNPEAGQELLFHNPSFVFFRTVTQVPPDKGPLGAMNRSITALRSIAVDPEFVTLGAPVWVEKGGDDPFNRLMVAQDTGSAIKGAQRADIFMGTGDEAGRAAGKLKDPGRMLVLLPIQRAYAMVPEDAQ